MSHSLLANITKKADLFYQHPDTLKSLILGGLYKLLN